MRRTVRWSARWSGPRWWVRRSACCSARWLARWTARLSARWTARLSARWTARWWVRRLAHRSPAHSRRCRRRRRRLQRHTESNVPDVGSARCVCNRSVWRSCGHDGALCCCDHPQHVCVCVCVCGVRFPGELGPECACGNIRGSRRGWQRGWQRRRRWRAEKSELTVWGCCPIPPPRNVIPGVHHAREQWSARAGGGGSLRRTRDPPSPSSPIPG